MKAPNKIYLHGYPDKPFLCQDWDVAPTKRVVRGQQAENIAYIRKDALLEWLKTEMKEWSSESNTAQGVKMGLTLVLDKIELL